LDTADTETKDASQAGFDAVSEVTGDTDGSERDSDAVDASLDEWNDIDPKLLKQLNRVIIEQLDCDE
jgi:hypothetical protein